MANILCWITAVIFGGAVAGSLSEGAFGVAFFAGLVFAAALPPLWATALRGVPSPGRWALGVIGGLCFVLALAANQPTSQPAAKSGNSAPQVASNVAKPAASAPQAAQPAAEAAAKAPANTNWSYSDDFDAMRKKSTYYACVKSDNELAFEFPYSGGSTGQICFRNSPKFGKDAILMIDKGQFECSFEGCVVHMKFDEGPILTFSANESADGSTNALFLQGYAKLLQHIRKSKKLIVEAAFYREGAQQLEFSVDGFDWKH